MYSSLLIASALAITPGEAAPRPPPSVGAPVFLSEAQGFSVRFPCAVREKPGTAATPGGPIALHEFRCDVVDKGATAFGVVVMAPPAAVADQVATLDAARALLQQTSAAIAAGAGGKVVHEGEVRVGPIAGYEVIVEAAGGRGRYRAFPHRGRLYQVIAIGKTQRASEADAFVESFELTPGSVGGSQGPAGPGRQEREAGAAPRDR